MPFASTALLQSAWVVPDLQSAMDDWLRTMKVGLFLTFEVSAPNALYRGRRSPLKMSIGLTQAGPMQIELIQQLSSGPSAYRDSVSKGQRGFHHVLRVAADYDAEVDGLRQRGIVLATEGELGDGLRWIYADTRAEIGCMLEIVPASPQIRALNQAVFEASIDWDGGDPIRPFNLRL